MQWSKFAVMILSVGWAIEAAAAGDAGPPGGEPLTEMQKAALNKTLESCAICHGLNGKSAGPTFPNLAAQTAPYIEAQLHAFKDQTRADPDAQAYMWGMASALSDATISELAAYYSAQPAPVGKSGDPALIARGRQIFENGIAARQIPACASCHGSHAEGQLVFPRLAGQHGEYLLKQLLVIQSVLRIAPVMHGVVKNLTREQMQAVVAYLESI